MRGTYDYPMNSNEKYLWGVFIRFNPNWFHIVFSRAVIGANTVRENLAEVFNMAMFEPHEINELWFLIVSHFEKERDARGLTDYG